MDRLTKEQRHKNMVANKSRGTKIELLLAKVLWNSGIRYRKNDNGVHGTPDFTLRGFRIAIFCDGEFWHGKDWETNKKKIKSNRSFWYAKIERNIKHDREITQQLESEGWKVFRFWETDIRKHADECANQVLSYVQKQRTMKSKVSLNRVTDDQKIPIQLEAGQQLAVVSHFLYNQKHPAAQPFEQPAKSIINHLYDLNEHSSTIDELVAEPEIQYALGTNVHTAPFLPVARPTFTFVDLFAGIGGIRLALQQLGGRCVFCSEWDAEAQYTYLQNFGEVPFGDITETSTKSLIPETFDLLCGHLPPQRFLLGKKKSRKVKTSKKELEREESIKEEIEKKEAENKKAELEQLRGTLFYHFAEILCNKHPKAFLLETDSSILTLDKGVTIHTLLNALRSLSEYSIDAPIVLKASDFGIPSDDERAFIIGYRADLQTEKMTAREAHSAVEAALYVPHSCETNTVTHKKNQEGTLRELTILKGFPADYLINQKERTAFKLLKNASVVTMVKTIGQMILSTLGKI